MKIQKFEYLKNKKSFLDEIKSIFHSFEGLSFGKKNKKIVDTSFKSTGKLKKSGKCCLKIGTFFNFFTLLIIYCHL